MIIKKPYAFLIKHFKLIHLILSIFILYLVFKTNSIFVFFNDYVKNGYYEMSTNLSSGYINFYMLLAVVVVLVLTSFIYLLMRWKKKSRLFYISICVFYFGLFIGLLFYFNVFQTIVNTTFDVRTVRAYRDIMILFYFPQYVFLLISIVRATGFNIKKFDFKSDLDDLDIAEEDQEEIEVTFSDNTYKVKRTFRKIFREIKYYAIENKFFFAVICGTIFLVLVSIVYFNSKVYTKTYNESEFFVVDGVTFSVLNSYVTDIDYKGSSIYKDKKYFVVKTSMVNGNTGRVNIKTDNLRLMINGKSYNPIYSLGDYFKDFGEAYYKNTLYAGETYEYLFIFELPKDLNIDEAYFSVLDSVNIIKGEIKSNHRDVKLKPIEYLKENNVKEYKVGDAISLEKSSLLKSEIMLNSYEIEDQFEEEYSYCTNKCYTGKEIIKPDNLGKSDRTILKLDMEVELSKDLYVNKFIKSNSDFIDLFGSISYVINGEEKTSSINVKKLVNAKSNSIYIEVPSEIRKSHVVRLNINVRNMKYMIELK